MSPGYDRPLYLLPFIRDANGRAYVVALSTKQSGSDGVQFDFGSAFAVHIESLSPTFAKVLIGHNPQGDGAGSTRQRARLPNLSDYSRGARRKLMLELPGPPMPAQLQAVAVDRTSFDRRRRPAPMMATTRALQENGVEPDIWKPEVPGAAIFEPRSIA